MSGCARELGYPADLARSLTNQARVLADMVGYRKPGLIEEADRVLAERSLGMVAQQLEPILRSVRTLIR